MAKKVIKKTILLDSLHPYVRPVNSKFVRTQAKKLGVSYSFLMDGMINHVRKTKLSFDIGGKTFIHRT